MVFISISILIMPVMKLVLLDSMESLLVILVEPVMVLVMVVLYLQPTASIVAQETIDR